MEVTVSTKYQIVIPKEARKKLGIRPGQKIHIDNVTNDSATLRRELTYEEYRSKHAGSLKDGAWQKEGVDAGEWLRRQRDSWDS